MRIPNVALLYVLACVLGAVYGVPAYIVSVAIYYGLGLVVYLYRPGYREIKGTHVPEACYQASWFLVYPLRREDGRGWDWLCTRRVMLHEEWRGGSEGGMCWVPAYAFTKLEVAPEEF